MDDHVKMITKLIIYVAIFLARTQRYYMHLPDKTAVLISKLGGIIITLNSSIEFSAVVFHFIFI